MTREHDFIKSFTIHSYMAWKPFNLPNSMVEPDTVREGLDNFLHILARSALDHSPLRAIINSEHSMVFKELDEETCRYIKNLGHRSRPNRSTHRDEIVFDKRLAEPVLIQEFA